jgi:hypothetical protein
LGAEALATVFLGAAVFLGAVLLVLILGMWNRVWRRRNKGWRGTKVFSDSN